MKRILTIELDYDAGSIHGGDNDQEAKDWFENEVLGGPLILYSNEIGEEVGSVRVIGNPLRAENARLRGELKSWEDFRGYFENMTYHSEGMGCGLEDRGITDRYIACEHGWDRAMERVYEYLPAAPASHDDDNKSIPTSDQIYNIIDKALRDAKVSNQKATRVLELVDFGLEDEGFAPILQDSEQSCEVSASPESVEEQEEDLQKAQVFAEAVNALYFDDSSKYKGTLYSIINIIKPDWNPDRMPFIETDAEALAALASSSPESGEEAK